MTKKLEPEDIFALSKQCRKCADMGTNKKEILAARNAPIRDIQVLEQKNGELRIMATKLNAIGILGVITDLEEAGSKLENSTGKLLKAVEKLDGIREFLKVIDLFIKLGSAIAGAGATGNNPPRKIAAIVSTIDDLTQSL